MFCISKSQICKDLCIFRVFWESLLCQTLFLFLLLLLLGFCPSFPFLDRQVFRWQKTGRQAFTLRSSTIRQGTLSIISEPLWVIVSLSKNEWGQHRFIWLWNYIIVQIIEVIRVWPQLALSFIIQKEKVIDREPSDLNIASAFVLASNDSFISFIAPIILWNYLAYLFLTPPL